jgi:hypothetical protein
MAYDQDELRIVRPYPYLTGKADPSLCTFIFNHIPKTGGTTLRPIIGGVASQQNRPYKIFLGGPELDIETVNAAINGHDFFHFIMGHSPFGAVKPSHCSYVVQMAVVRDPIERVISQIKMNESQTGETIHQIPPSNGANAFVDNLQTRLLAGSNNFMAPCTRQTLEDAYSNIEKNLSLIGFTEDFDQFLSSFLALVNGPSVIYARRQVSQNIITKDRYSMLRDQVIKREIFDVELVDYLRKNYERLNQRLFEKTSKLRVSDQTIISIPRLRFGEAINTSETRQNHQALILPSEQEEGFLTFLKQQGFKIEE